MAALPAVGTPLHTLATNDLPVGFSPHQPRLVQPFWPWYAREFHNLGPLRIGTIQRPDRSDRISDRTLYNRQIIWDPYQNIPPIQPTPSAIFRGSIPPKRLNWIQAAFLMPWLPGITLVCLRDEEVYAHIVRNICWSSNNWLQFDNLTVFDYFSIHVKQLNPDIHRGLKSVTIHNLIPFATGRNGMAALRSCTNLEFLEVQICPRCRDFRNKAVWDLWLTYRAPPSLRAPPGQILVTIRSGVWPQLGPPPPGHNPAHPWPPDIPDIVRTNGHFCYNCNKLGKNRMQWPKRDYDTPRWQNVQTELLNSFLS